MAEEGKLLVRATLPGRVGIKKNRTQRRYSFARKRTVTMPSDEYLIWERQAVAALQKHWNDRPAIDKAVHVRLTFWFLNHSGEPDLSNCYQGPEDALQKAGVIENDKLIRSHDGSRKRFGRQPCVEIEVYEYKGEL